MVGLPETRTGISPIPYSVNSAIVLQVAGRVSRKGAHQAFRPPRRQKPMKAIIPIALIAAALATSCAKPKEPSLVAIDVLLEPDQRMVQEATAWNARLREQMPEGFSLDAAHRPHITLLQLYVAKQDLPAVVDKVQALAATEKLNELNLTANGLYHIPSGQMGLQGITVKPSKEILALQARVIEALAPFRKSGGKQDAFVHDPTGAPFDPFLFSYVDGFVEKSTGDAYNPHVTTGTGPIKWVEAREREPFEPFDFGVDRLSVYKLGNFGTAAERVSD